MKKASMFSVAALVTAAIATHAGVFAQAQRPSGEPAVRAAIEAANKKHFMDAAPTGNAALVAAVYTDDAIVYPPNSDAVKGRAALQGMWMSVFQSGIAGFELNTEEVESSSSSAWETGTYALKLKDGTVVDRGKYIVVWKRVDGAWKIHRDIWNTSLPAAK